MPQTALLTARTPWTNHLIPAAITPLRWSFTLLASTAIAFAPATAQAEPQSPLIAQTTLQVGTEADYIPFEFRVAADPPSGIIGFDIALAEMIADRLDLELDIQDQAFDSLLPALQAGELDFAIAAITPTDRRRQLVDFSIPYFESRQALISHRTNPIRTVRDLEGQRVAVQSGTIQAQALDDFIAIGFDVEVIPFDKLNDIVTAVRDREVDVAIAEELVAEAYLENNPTLVFDVLGEIPPTPIAIAFPKGSPYIEPFNQVIAELEASGELASLARAWFVMQP